MTSKINIYVAQELLSESARVVIYNGGNTKIPEEKKSYTRSRKKYSWVEKSILKHIKNQEISYRIKEGMIANNPELPYTEFHVYISETQRSIEKEILFLCSLAEQKLWKYIAVLTSICCFAYAIGTGLAVRNTDNLSQRFISSFSEVGYDISTEQAEQLSTQAQQGSNVISLEIENKGEKEVVYCSLTKEKEIKIYEKREGVYIRIK